MHPVTHAAFEEVPWHLFGTLAVGRSQLSFRTPYMDNRMVELAYPAPAHLRRTPAPALRLVHDNDPALAAMPTDRGVAWGAGGVFGRCAAWCAGADVQARLLAQGRAARRADADRRLLGTLARAGVLGTAQVPGLPGMVPPRAGTLCGAGDLADGRTRGLPFWNAAALRRVAEDHARGRRNRLRDLHAVISLEAVHRMLIDPRAYCDEATQPNEEPKS